MLRHLRRLVPGEGIVYAADTAWCPYGPRPAGEVQARVERVVQSLREREAKLVVVACNSASAVALETLRRRWPRLPFVGTEPAVKPAALRSRTRRVGVLATSTTARGAPLARLIERFADPQGVTVEVAVPEGLVELVESGEGNSGPRRRCCGRSWRAGRRGVDVVVLGCTHFPFARRAIERLVTQGGGAGMEILDPRRGWPARRYACWMGPVRWPRPEARGALLSLPVGTRPRSGGCWGASGRRDGRCCAPRPCGPCGL